MKLTPYPALPLQGKGVSPRTSHGSGQCGGILPLKGEMPQAEGVRSQMFDL